MSCPSPSVQRRTGSLTADGRRAGKERIARDSAEHSISVIENLKASHIFRVAHDVMARAWCHVLEVLPAQDREGVRLEPHLLAVRSRIVAPAVRLPLPQLRLATAHPCRARNQVSDVAASLLNVLSCASSLGLRARGGRTLLQTGESKDKLPTTFVTNVCPSHRRFQPISADIERSRKPSEEARFRALKAVARVRIPSGLPGGIASQRLFRVASQFNHLTRGTQWVHTRKR